MADPAVPPEDRSWFIRKATARSAEPFDTARGSIIGPNVEGVGVVPAAEVERLREALAFVEATAKREGEWTKESIWFDVLDVVRSALAAEQGGEDA